MKSILRFSTTAVLMALLISFTVTATAWADGGDDFESYALATDLGVGSKSGSTLVGEVTNGQVSWIQGTKNGLPFGANTVTVVDNSGDQVAQYADVGPFGFGDFEAVLTEDRAIFLAPGQSAKLSVEFNSIMGDIDFAPMFTGNRTLFGYDPIESGKAYTSTVRMLTGGFSVIDEDSIGQLGNPLTPLTNSTWYRMDYTIARNDVTAAQPGMYNVSVSVFDRASGIQVGNTVTSGSATDGLRLANRPFIKGMRFTDASTTEDTLQFDNLSFTRQSGGPGAGTLEASDNFDGIAGGAGTNILGTSNGQVTWQAANSLGDGTVQVSTDTPSGSGQSLQYVSDSFGGGGSFIGGLAPANAIGLNTGDSARMSFDFMAVGAQTSTVISLLYSSDANGTDQDIIGGSHLTSIADNGSYNVGSLTPSTVLFNDPESGNEAVIWGGELYDANTWYHAEIDVTRATASTRDIRFRISDLATGGLLGELIQEGLFDEGRTFITGLQIFGSSNASETFLLDNLVFEKIATTDDADFDNDGNIDGADFLTWQRGFGASGDNSMGDADGNGNVDGLDLAIWEGQFGTVVSSLSSVSSVPEPSTFLLTMMVGCLLLTKRSRDTR